MERLADVAGRAIRYGGAPERRGEDVAILLNISREIGEIEDIFTRLNQLMAGWSPPRRMASMQRDVRLYLAKIEGFRQSLRGREREIRIKLEVLIAREEFSS